jgi:hypothetical protein
MKAAVLLDMDFFFIHIYSFAIEKPATKRFFGLMSLGI